MRKTIKIAVLISTLVSGFYLQGLAADAGPIGKEDVVSGDLGAKIDLFLSRITPFGFAGCVLVAKDDHIIVNKGYGWAVRSQKIPNTSGSVIVIGSITKQFTAAGILKLEMQGKLKTTDLLTRFFENVPEDKKGITLHHLLTHTSGLIGYTGGDSDEADFEPAERDATMKKAFAAPLLFTPGTQYSYSNTGYSVLAAIIEKLSGKSYEQYLNENLWKPAGMFSTGYRLPDWSKHVVAHYYSGDKDYGTFLEKPYPYWNLLGNGGILTTTGEMFRWHLALEGDKILSAEEKKKLYTPFLNNYACGWDVTQSDHGLLIQHNGGGSFGASDTADFLRFVDARVVIIVLCHQAFEGTGVAFSISPQIAKLVFGGEVEIPPAAKSSGGDDLSRYAGEYALAEGARIRVINEGRFLMLTPDGQEAFDLLAYPEAGNSSPRLELNGRAKKIMSAILQGDFKPAEDALADQSESRIKRLRGVWEHRLEELKQAIGPLIGVEVMATLPIIPASYGEKVSDITTVLIKGEKGKVGVGMDWENGKLIGFRDEGSAGSVRVPFVATAPNEFAGYHLFIGKNVGLGVEIDKKGTVTGMRFKGPGQQKLLPKVK